MKILYCTILFIFISCFGQAQQVTKVECCLELGGKASIIINDNSSNSSTPNASPVNTTTVNGGFDFKLDADANTSAGVYDKNDVLIRTLWSGVRYEAGCYHGQWDGYLDDEVTLAPLGSYTVKVLTNNVQYTWEGVIGNTSASLTDNVFLGFAGNSCFTSVGNRMFYGQFFYEGNITSKYFNLNDIQKTYDVIVGVHAITVDCATDGTNIYWACADQYQNGGINNGQTNYIFATKAADNTPVSFTNESSHPTGREGEVYPHLLGYFADGYGTAAYTSIAVNSNFIFTAIGYRNQVLIINKVSGAVLQTLTYNNPGRMAAGSNNELWMIVNGVLKKFSVNSSSGALTSLNITAPAVNPHTVKISPDNSTVLVSDIGTHQVKAYSNSTGALLWTLGQPGGYDTNGPTITNDKFMFNRYDLTSPAITYQADGSFWINDVGNYRMLHFNADRSYKEQISFIPSFRSVNVDHGKPGHIFADELEFQRDYSKPLDNGTNGSWKLIKNWKVGTHLDAYRRFTQVETLSNGHTYASGDNNLYDLTDNGAVLLSNSFLGTNFKIEADGSLYTKYVENSQYFRIGRQPLTGFDGNNMPQWGNTTILAISPNVTATNAFSFNNNTRGSATNSKYFFSYNANNISDFGVGYHLGGIKTSGTTWAWQTSKSTFFDYHGDYPRNGDFDIGNNDYTPQHSENCQVLVQGTDVFWNVNAEFWKANAAAGGANIFNHYNEDGLLIGNFGKTAVDALHAGNNNGFVGNGFSTALAKVGSDYYIYQCDESKHGGITSWKVTGINTIAEQPILVIVSTPIKPVADPADLMTGLPYKSDNFSGGSGWSVNTSGSLIKTNIYTYQKNDPSINTSGGGNQTLSRSLNNTVSLLGWQLTGALSFQGTEPTMGNDNYNYLELVDVTGKVICRYFEQADNQYNRTIKINDKIVFQGANGSTEFLKNYNSFSYSYANAAITFKIGNLPQVVVSSVVDAGAEMSKPALLRVKQASPYNQNHVMDLSKLRFIGK